MIGYCGWRDGARRFVALTAMASLVGCSLLDPYVEPAPKLLEDYQASHSLTSATLYSEALQQEYLGAISDQAMLKSTVGLALIPVSAAALYFGIQGIHPDTVLALGLGGAGSYLGAQYLTSQPRELIYVAGANAISCAVIAMSPIRAATTRLNEMRADELAAAGKEVPVNAPPPSLTPSLVKLRTAINDLESLVSPYKNLASNPELDYELGLLTEAKAVLTEGRAANTVITTSGDTLFGSVQQIRGVVTRAIIETEPNLSALVSSLSSALPLRANQIAPAVKKPEKSTDVKNDAEGQQTALLANRTERVAAERDLVAATEEVRGVVELVKAGPSRAYLDACGVNIKEAGLNFAITPDTPVAFVNAATVETHTVSISGGQSPYSATWAGATPADLTLTLTYEADGKGVLTIKESAAKSADQTYSLNIHDAGSNAAILEVTTGTGGGGGGGGGGGNANDKELYDLLVARQCLAASADGPTKANLDKGIAALKAKHNDMQNDGPGNVLKKMRENAALGCT